MTGCKEAKDKDGKDGKDGKDTDALFSPEFIDPLFTKDPSTTMKLVLPSKLDFSTIKSDIPQIKKVK